MEYVHGTSSSEQERLEIQNRLIGGSAFLPRLARGIEVLDAGCGTGAVAREVAAKVARVTAVDLRKAQIAAARKLSRGITNLEFATGDISHLQFRDDRFDLAYCRFVLEHVPDPLAAIKELARVTRSGGTVVACECAIECCSSTSPRLPNASAALGALYETQKRSGGDPFIGERLRELFFAAGLKRVRCRTITFKFTTPAELAQYAEGAIQMIRAAKRQILDSMIVSRKLLQDAYAEWRRLPNCRGAVAFFKLRVATGRTDHAMP